MAALIDHELHRCKSDRVDAIFIPSEANVIKAIPLSLLDTLDWLYWPKNCSGVYLVKTRYNLAWEWETLDAPEVFDQIECNATWKKVWNLHVLNRIRSLLWGATNDSFPTKVNLARRKLLQVDTCPKCNLELETVVHALWSCQKLDPVWLPQFAKLKEATSPLSCFFELMYLALQDPSCVEVFANTISLIWMSRNKAAFGSACLPLEKIPEQAHALVHEFHHLRLVHAKIPRTAHGV